MPVPLSYASSESPADFAKQLLSLIAKFASGVPVLPVVIKFGMFAWQGMDTYYAFKANHFQVDRKTFLNVLETVLSALAIATDQEPSLKPFVESITEPAAVVLHTVSQEWLIRFVEHRIGDKRHGVYAFVKNPEQPFSPDALVLYAEWSEVISKFTQPHAS